MQTLDEREQAVSASEAEANLMDILSHEVFGHRPDRYAMARRTFKVIDEFVAARIRAATGVEL